MRWDTATIFSVAVGIVSSRRSDCVRIIQAGFALLLYSREWRQVVGGKIASWGRNHWGILSRQLGNGRLEFDGAPMRKPGWRFVTAPGKTGSHA